MRRTSIIVLSVVTLAVLFVVLCTYTKRPYEAIVLDRFGKIVDNPTNIAYGWYLKWPTDSVVRLDTRLHLHQTMLSQVVMAGGEPISVKAFAAWRIVNPVLFYKRFQGSDEAAANQLDTKVSEQVAAVLGRHHLDELFNATTLVAATQDLSAEHAVAGGATQKMEDEITRAVSTDMAPQGIQVDKVGFSRMAFPPNVAQAVYDRMSQERETLATSYRSQGEAQATQIRALADAQAAKTKADAEQTAAQIMGEGDSDALKLLNDAQKTPDARAFYRFWREMQLLKTSIGKGTYLVLRSDDPVINQLFPMAQQAAGGQAQKPVPAPGAVSEK